MSQTKTKVPLRKCPRCKEIVGANSCVCPRCGASFRAATLRRLFFYLIVLAVAAYLAYRFGLTARLWKLVHPR